VVIWLEKIKKDINMNIDKKYCVYKHLKSNGEVFYIGIGAIKRARVKYKRSIFWKNIVDKHNYTIEILSDNLSWENAQEAEIQLIKLYGRRDLGLGTLVNLTDGGDGSVGVIVSEETKLKLSKSLKGKMTNETKLKILEKNKNKIYTEEYKEKLRKGSTVFKKGHILSNETKLKMSLNNAKSKPVICTITNKTWKSIKDCALENNINVNTLFGYLTNAVKNKTTFKLISYESV